MLKSVFKISSHSPVSIPILYSFLTTGVKLQRLDDGDHLSEVVLVPREQIEGKDQPVSVEQN